MRRKLLSLLLSLVMVLSLLPVSAFAVEYSDTNDAAWAAEAIDRWSSYGVVGGADGKFRPNANMTRAEAATVFTNLLGLTSTEGAASFADMTADKWYYGAIQKANAAGIINGSYGYMNPDSPVTREMFFTMFARALGFKPQDTTSGAKADGSSWSAGYINALTDKGYVKGDGTGVNATANINRASVMTLLNQTITTYANENGKTYEDTGKGVMLVTADDCTITGKIDTLVIAGNSEDEAVAKAAASEDGPITATLVLAASKKAIKIENATISSVNVVAPATVSVGEGATIETVAVTEQAEEVKVEVAEGAKVAKVETEAETTEISGKGEVTNVEATGAAAAEEATVTVTTPNTEVKAIAAAENADGSKTVTITESKNDAQGTSTGSTKTETTVKETVAADGTKTTETKVEETKTDAAGKVTSATTTEVTKTENTDGSKVESATQSVTNAAGQTTTTSGTVTTSAAGATTKTGSDMTAAIAGANTATAAAEAATGETLTTDTGSTDTGSTDTTPTTPTAPSSTTGATPASSSVGDATISGPAVTFSANGGVGTMNPQAFTAGTAFNLSANTFTREGYAFKYWATNAGDDSSAAGYYKYDDGGSVTLSAATVLYAIWDQLTIDHIGVKTAPATLEYRKGVEASGISLSGLVLTVYYSGTDYTQDIPYTAGSTDIVATAITDTTAAGGATVTVKYKGDKTTTFNVDIVDKRPVALTLDASKVKTEYVVGQTIDLTELRGTITFREDDPETYAHPESTLTDTETDAGVITDRAFRQTGFDSSAPAAAQTVTVYVEGYEDLTATFNVSIVAKAMTDAEIKSTGEAPDISYSKPSKTEYVAGEEVNLEGLVLTVTYNDGSNADVTYGPTTAYMFSASPATIQNGTESVTVTYTEDGVSKDVSFDVTTTNTYTVSVNVTTGSTTKTALEDAIVTLTGAEDSTPVTATWDADSKTYQARVKADTYTVTATKVGYETTEQSSVTVTVTDGAKTVNYGMAVDADATTRSVKITVKQQAAAQATVLAGATVTVKEGNTVVATGTTDSKGEVTLTLKQNTEYTFNASKDGYQAAAEDGTIASGTENITDATITLPKLLTVTFNANGGSGEMAAQEVPYGVQTALSANTFIAPAGYTFSKWTTQQAPTPEQLEAGINNQGNVTLTAATTYYAQWTPLTNLTVTYKPNLESLVGKKDVADAFNISDVVNNSQTASRTYELSEGEATFDPTVTTGVLSAVETAHSQDSDYNPDWAEGQILGVFSGWNTDADGNGQAYAPGATIDLTGDLTLYAIWAEPEHDARRITAMKVTDYTGDRVGNDFTASLGTWSATEFGYGIAVTYPVAKVRFTPTFPEGLEVYYATDAEKIAAIFGDEVTDDARNEAMAYATVSDGGEGTWTKLSEENVDLELTAGENNEIVFAIYAADHRSWASYGVSVERVSYVEMIENLLDASDEVTLTLSGTVAEDEKLEIPEHKTLTIDGEATLTNEGTIVNKGKITNKGEIASTGTLTNEGEIDSTVGVLESNNVPKGTKLSVYYGKVTGQSSAETGVALAKAFGSANATWNVGGASYKKDGTHTGTSVNDTITGLKYMLVDGLESAKYTVVVKYGEKYYNYSSTSGSKTQLNFYEACDATVDSPSLNQAIENGEFENTEEQLAALTDVYIVLTENKLTYENNDGTSTAPSEEDVIIHFAYSE